MARLAEQRRLLVAGDPGDRHARRRRSSPRRRRPTRRTIARQHRARNVEQAQAARRPTSPRVDVEEQRAARVGRIGDVRRAAGQLPDEPRVDGAERELAAQRPLARAGHVVEQPLELGAREIGVEDEAGLARRSVAAWPAARSSSQMRRRPPVLPDDRVGDRPAGRAIPQHRRLALIGDADRGDVRARDPGLGERFVHARPTASPRSPSRRARPSRAAERSAGTPLRDARAPSPA